MAELGGEPEIDEFGGIARHEDVLGFQIAMGEPLFVDGFDGIENGDDRSRNRASGMGPACCTSTSASVCKREVLHGDVELFSDRSALVDGRRVGGPVRSSAAHSRMRRSVARYCSGVATLMATCCPVLSAVASINDAEPSLTEDALDAITPATRKLPLSLRPAPAHSGY